MKSFLEEIDGLNELIYMSDLETHELLYLNDFGMKQFGVKSRKDLQGRKCYEILQGLDYPCEFCTNHLLKEDHFYEWEFTNRLRGTKYILKDKLVEYEGRKVRMEVALDVSELEDQKKRMERILANEQIVLKGARKLQEADAGEAVLQETLRILTEYLRGDTMYIFEICGSRMEKSYEWYASHISRETYKLPEVLQISQSRMEEFERKKVFILQENEDLETKGFPEYQRLKAQGVKSLIAVPMYKQDQIMGILGIHNPVIENEDNIVETLSIMAFFIQSALTRIKENENLIMKSYTDIMTGVRNRNAYMHDVEKMNENLHRREAKCSYGVIFVDVNGLKKINDYSGHEAGDRRLIWVASRIQEVFPSELVYRTGGDEFVIICPYIIYTEFLKKIGSLKDRLCGKANQDSASIGARWSDEFIYLEEIINLAEAEMYEAKKRYYSKRENAEYEDDQMLQETRTHTSLLLKDTDVVKVASELLHLIFEKWDEERLALLLDEDFVLFDAAHSATYSRIQVIAYLKGKENYQSWKLRDMEFIRKRVVKGVSICISKGWLDWREGGRTSSIPMEMTLVLVQKEGRGRCLYMHGADVFSRMEAAKGVNKTNYVAFLDLYKKDFSHADEPAKGTGEKNEKMLGVLAEVFQVMTQEYSNVYYVDIQKDTYIVLKQENRFQELVGFGGNYTSVNRDYADLFIEETIKGRYLEFTSRRNLLSNLEAGNNFLNMGFSTSEEKTKQSPRGLEIGIWLGKLNHADAAVIAYRSSQIGDQEEPAYKRDKLTGLLSYEEFRAEGRRILEEDTKGWIMLSSDIQNFKYINEVLGYEAGDNVLRAYAKSIPHMTEKMYHTRVSADLYLSFFSCALERNVLLEQIKEKVNLFCEDQKRRNDNLRFVLRVGIYFFDKDCREIDTVIDRANLARKSIGQSMNSEISIYGEEIVRRTSMHNEILATMEKALANREFQVWLQPKIDLWTRRLCGAEALVRWVKDGEIKFYPSDFIPIFEQNGFISSLDLYVLEDVCRQMLIRRQKAGRQVCPVSVNLSAVDIQQGGIVEAIKEIVQRYEVPFEDIEFELTETAYFNNSNLAAYVMQRLQEEGFTTSVDDFGSGYSVMNMLANMPASVVKIDRMFMVDSLKTEKGKKFLEKLIVLIHELEYRVLCEGIETEEQYKIVRAMGCDEGQGFYFYKPMPADEFYRRFG